jgi:hypothetical protein
MLGIAITLLLVGTDYRNNYHFSFLTFSIPLFIVSIIFFLSYIYSDTVVKHYRKDRFRYPVRIAILSSRITDNDPYPCRFRGGPDTQGHLTEHHWYATPKQYQ